MAGKPTIQVTITADAHGAKRGTDQAASYFSEFGRKTSGILVGVGAELTRFGIQAGRSLIDAAGDWINLAQQAEIYESKANTVFGNNAQDVKQWADQVNESFGVSDEAVVGMAASIGDLLVPLGFSREKAAAMSKEMVNLSGALSAWSGGTISASDVADRLTKAMLGETEGLKELGISIRQEEVMQRVAENATKGLTFATEAQARAFATQQLIVEKSTDAQTAWTDGTMDNVKAANEAKAAWEDAKTELGNALLPIVQRVTKWFVEDFLPAAREVVAEFQERWPKIREVIENVVNWIRDDAWPVIEAVIQFIREGFRQLSEWVQEHWEEIKTTIQSTIEAIAVIIETVVTVIKNIWRVFGNEILMAAELVWNHIRGVVEAAVNIIRGIIQVVTSLIRGDWAGVWDGIKSIVEGVWIAIRTLIESTLAAIRLMISTAWSAVKEVFRISWEGIKELFSSIWDGLTSRVGDGVRAIIDFVKSIPRNVAGAIGDGFNAIWDAFKSVINRIIDAWNNLGFTLPSVSVDWNGPLPGGDIDIGGWTISTPNLPKLHGGGIVPGAPGSDVLAILQAGERVLPRNGGGGGAPTIVVHAEGAVGLSGPQVEQWVAEALTRWQRRNGQR